MYHPNYDRISNSYLEFKSNSIQQKLTYYDCVLSRVMTGYLRLVQISFVPAEGKSDKQDVYKSLETKNIVTAKSAAFSANIQG